MYVIKARLRDYKINEEYRQREKIKYPDCIGTFPECCNLKVGETCSDCALCCRFSKESFEKLHGGANMKDKKKDEKPKQAVVKETKPKRDKEQETKDKIRQMIENFKNLKPSQRAWLKIYAKKGLCDMAEIEKLEASVGGA